jgi:hypothetical protein
MAFPLVIWNGRYTTEEGLHKLLKGPRETSRMWHHAGGRKTINAAQHATIKTLVWRKVQASIRVC